MSTPAPSGPAAERIAGFVERRVRVGEVSLSVAERGSGPVVLLLHGYPQSRYMWRHVAPALARRSRVVCADLRGYGDSDAPPGGPGHAAYSKRAMARDQVELMDALGADRFAVVGHDRGARVAHRLALDHADRVERLALLDIVPTATLLARADTAFATAYFHWYFLVQPEGLPERMIGADPAWWVRHLLERWSGGPGAFDERAIAEYVRCFARPETIHASCEDYRAAASVDLEHDAADAGARIVCPTLVLWGARGAMGQLYDVLATWRDRAPDVRGRALDCGHFLAEERPEETARELERFLAESPPGRALES